jgi:hypothetical protein
MSWLLHCFCSTMKMECSKELVRGEPKQPRWDYGNLLATSSNKNFTVHYELQMSNIGKRREDGKTNWHDHLLWMDPHWTARQAVTYKLYSFRHVGYPKRQKENIPFGSTLLLMINTEPTEIILRPKKSRTLYIFHEFVTLPPPAISLHLQKKKSIYIFINKSSRYPQLYDQAFQFPGRWSCVTG